MQSRGGSYCSYSEKRRSGGRNGQVGIDPAPPEALGDDEGELEGLRGVEPWVAVGVVPRAQVVEGHRSRPSDALRHVLPCHLQVHAAGVAPFLLVDIEEGPHLCLRYPTKTIQQDILFKELLIKNDIRSNSWHLLLA